jgi:GT2 family glycosyltransferase
MFPKLPPPPDEEEVRRHTPAIEPVAGGVDRPFWSVMIPTYNCADYLRKTLGSVLSQAPGPNEMQIEIVDDVSTKDDPAAVVEELGRGRVSFFRNPVNLGATATFNRCIERARGRWVHILHGDDMVLPGFYQAHRELIDAHPEAVMVFGQVVYIDETDRWTGIVGPLPPDDGSIVKDFYQVQAVKQLGHFVGVVVRRDAYESVGGFCTLFHHVADWNMWFRIARVGPVAQVNRPYGLYRMHQASDTSKLMIGAVNTKEFYNVSSLHAKILENGGITEYDRTWKTDVARYAESFAWNLRNRGSAEGYWNQMRVAWMVEPNYRRFKYMIKSYLKYKIKNS